VKNETKVVNHCKHVIRKATRLFPHIDLATVNFRFDLHGKQISQARSDYGEYSIRFNTSYFHSIEYVIEDTIPHEIAHLCCFQDLSLGYQHDKGWATVCKELGGSGKTLHDIPVLYCRETYEYITSTGFVVRVSKIMHDKVQNGAIYRYSVLEGDINCKCEWFLVV
jgi:predicted SprT family Zn-dependent metalloprotease